MPRHSLGSACPFGSRIGANEQSQEIAPIGEPECRGGDRRDAYPTMKCWLTSVASLRSPVFPLPEHNHIMRTNDARHGLAGRELGIGERADDVAMRRAHTHPP